MPRVQVGRARLPPSRLHPTAAQQELRPPKVRSRTSVQIHLRLFLDYAMAGMSFERSEVKGLVSIIIPTYRAERFIGNALAPVAQQAYPHWEVIVVEDASCDGTQQIVDDFARRN